MSPHTIKCPIGLCTYFRTTDCLFITRSESRTTAGCVMGNKVVLTEIDLMGKWSIMQSLYVLSSSFICTILPPHTTHAESTSKQNYMNNYLIIVRKVFGNSRYLILREDISIRVDWFVHFVRKWIMCLVIHPKISKYVADIDTYVVWKVGKSDGVDGKRFKSFN